MLKLRTMLSPLATLAIAGAVNAQCPATGKLTQGSFSENQDHFGASISMSFGGPSGSPLLVVGQPNEDAPTAGTNAGGYSVYQKINGWSLLTSAWNNTGEGGELLGASVGLSDPYLIAGAPAFGDDKGRARILTRSGGSYFHTTWLTPGIGGNGDKFGSAVAISTYGGGWCVVGAPFHDFHGEVDAGAAFFYIRNANGTWTQEYQIWGGDFGGAHGEHRGESVAMAQNSRYAAVGAPNAETGSNPADHGIVHIVTRLDNGLPGSPTSVAPPSPEGGEHFGAAVAIEGDLLVVGAPDEDFTFQENGFQQNSTDSGAIYIFERTGFNWNFVAKLRSPEASSARRFGAQVATNGVDQIMVSEPGSKRVYFFTKEGGTWHYQGAISDPDAAAAGSFGTSVAMRGNDYAVGDQADDHDGATDAGAVYTSSMSANRLVGDTCVDPVEIPAGNYLGCTLLASPSNQQVTTCGNGGDGQGPDVWFTFHPQCDGNAIFDTFGSEFDTVLSVHSNCPNIFNSNSVLCNDDASFAPPNNRASLVTFNFTGGATYLIRVAGYNGASGAFTLRHLYTYGTSNDTCATASTMGLGSVNFNNCSATSSALGATCGGGTAYRDVWYRFIAPQPGPYVISTCGSFFDTVLTVYNGTQANCPASTGAELACNDDSQNAGGCGFYQSRVVLTLAGGQSIMMRVGGFDNEDFGPGTITVAQAPACSADFNNDGFRNPDDLADFITCFFLDVQFPGLCGAADFNSDGFRDPDDLADFITAFFLGCP